MGTDRTGGATASGESVVVSEQIDAQYEPTPAEVMEYGDWLGMDRDRHRHLMWIAREALKAPLPEHWKLCESPHGACCPPCNPAARSCTTRRWPAEPCPLGGAGDLFYFHFKSGQSSWDHPSDASFQALFQRCKDTGAPVPGVACDAEAAAAELELRQLLRRARQLGAVSHESAAN
jgi:centrosomal protein CEP164